MSPDNLQASGEFVVGLGTLMLINAVLAQGKNRRGVVWFFVTLLLGPLATLILALVKKLPEESQDSAV